MMNVGKSHMAIRGLQSHLLPRGHSPSCLSGKAWHLVPHGICPHLDIFLAVTIWRDRVLLACSKQRPGMLLPPYNTQDASINQLTVPRLRSTGPAQLRPWPTSTHWNYGCGVQKPSSQPTQNNIQEQMRVRSIPRWPQVTSVCYSLSKSINSILY